MPHSRNFTITANLVDIFNQSIYPAEVIITEGKIGAINRLEIEKGQSLPYILPGFIDSHVHIESSLLVPAEFARLAVVHGTVATVSDPHEIANVCGLEGVEFMIQNGNTVPFKFNFGAPSCVPATPFETAGANLDSTEVEKLLQRSEIRYLSEMMNFPGVLNQDEEVMKKINTARRFSKPVDGHAPGLHGEQARQYITASSDKDAVIISTDHECFTAGEALDKLKYGMKILIREGSAAKNFDALIDLLNDYPDSMMFCSDDKHPDSLVLGHINQLCQRAVTRGIHVFNVLKAACINPVLHYGLDVGLLRKEDPADFILVKDLQQFEVLKTFINGELVAENGDSLINPPAAATINHFSCDRKLITDFAIKDPSWIWKDEAGKTMAWVIGALDGQLITEKLAVAIEEKNGGIISQPDNDVLKMVVVNRYQNAPVAGALIKNFGLKRGALASSVAHDSHNIVAVGVNDECICRAVNAIIDQKGGLSFATEDEIQLLPLPVAGLMSTEPGYEVARQYSRLDAAVKAAGSTLHSPFMTLSFMALLVIPHLKLSDKGLFDGDGFQFI